MRRLSIVLPDRARPRFTVVRASRIVMATRSRGAATTPTIIVLRLLMMWGNAPTTTPSAAGRLYVFV